MTRLGLYPSSLIGAGTEAAIVTASMTSVTRDATSQIYVPSTSSEWTTTLSVAGLSGSASFLWLCQEASGNLADTIGGVSLTVSGTPAFQQTATGWSRKALQLTDASSQAWSSTSASLPDISTTSFLLLMYTAVLSAPAGVRALAAMGTTAAKMRCDTTPHPQASSAGNVATGTGTLSSAVIPFVLKCDRTNSTVTGYTLADKMTPTFSGTMTGKKITLGTDTAASAAAQQILYAAAFVGASAELSDAQIKTLLQTLGWSPSWT